MANPHAAVVRLSDHPQLLESGRSLLAEYFGLPDAWARGEAPDPLPPEYEEHIAGYPNDGQPPHGETFLALRSDDVVGQVLVVPHAEGVVRLERMYVLPAEREQGVARALIAAATIWGREHGVRRVVIGLLPGRREAISLFRGIGFKPAADYIAEGRTCMGLDLALAD
ncbi:GNAT family N-acetyltransferase [Demequina sp.]|uniref:GNAT family N-acetyltransferase n=1 Tax=Demequina sp. TaxID=2050685 RepID=UPI003D10EBFF